jgi:hypothetical protein
MAGSGHEDPFPPPELSACYVIRQETFAGTHGNGRDAPIPDLPFLLLVMATAEAEPFSPQGRGRPR